jgi:hypothetical protein
LVVRQGKHLDPQYAMIPFYDTNISKLWVSDCWLVFFLLFFLSFDVLCIWNGEMFKNIFSQTPILMNHTLLKW